MSRDPYADCKRVCGAQAGCFPEPCRIDHPVAEPAPPTDRLREALDRVAIQALRGIVPLSQIDQAGRFVIDRLLEGPLQRLIAAEARVRSWAAMHDDMARQYEEAANSVQTLALVDEALQHAEDCRAIAEGVRRALDGDRG